MNITLRVPKNPARDLLELVYSKVGPDASPEKVEEALNYLIDPWIAGGITNSIKPWREVSSTRDGKTLLFRLPKIQEKKGETPAQNLKRLLEEMDSRSAFVARLLGAEGKAYLIVANEIKKIIQRDYADQLKREELEAQRKEDDRKRDELDKEKKAKEALNRADTVKNLLKF